MTTTAATIASNAAAGRAINITARKRMLLSAVTKGKVKEPYRVLMYGREKIGKSSWAAGAPAPIFIDAENGTTELDVARFPKPESWEDVFDAINELAGGGHEFKTVVFDTVDWLEGLCWKHVCHEGGQESIEAFGYGKGYTAALDEWRRFVAALDRLVAANMNVILLAHSSVRSFKNPEGEDYDRYELKLHVKAAGLLKEWPKALLLAKDERFAVKDEKTKRVRGVSSGQRLVCTEPSAAYDAGNRYNLPPTLDLSWDAFANACESHADRNEELKKQIRESAKALGGDLETKLLDSLGRLGDDTAKLAATMNWAQAQISKKEAANAG